MSGTLSIGGKQIFSHSDVTDKVTYGSGIPVGSVVQTFFNQTTSQTTITSSTKGSGTPTTLSVSIKPQSINNKLLFFCNLLYYIEDADIAFGVEIYDGSSVVYTDETTNPYNRNSDGTERAGGRYNFMAFINPSSTNTLTYTVRAFKGASGDTFRVQENSNPSNIVVQEIQQ